MEILKFNSYLDGGTIEVTTDKGVYCFDGRLFSDTKDCVFEGYPKDDNSNIVEESEELEAEITEALRGYKDSFCQNEVDYFVGERDKE
jgi:hypothetical protein|tara:strand:- start:21308 stop:21571 length:264 start_codon:yes stop_codon:yes gene_type:complete